MKEPQEINIIMRTLRYNGIEVEYVSTMQWQCGDREKDEHIFELKSERDKVVLLMEMENEENHIIAWDRQKTYISIYGLLIDLTHLEPRGWLKVCPACNIKDLQNKLK